MTPTVKSGLASAKFSMTDWESFDVRFGSEADIARCPRCVRFPLDNGHCSDELARLLSANSGTLSFDHLIGAEEHGMVRLQPESFRRAVDANPT